nr:energy transducer TonB [Bacteriovorax sp. HI3]
MPKITYSIILAVGVHIIVLLLSGLFLSKDSWRERNLIDIQFTSSGGGSRLFPDQPDVKKATGVKTKKAIALGQESASAAAASIGASATTSEAQGSAQGPGSGPGPGFNESVTSFSEPDYPRLAVKRSLEGQVKLRVNVSSEGLPENTAILESSGHDILDRAALEATKKWRFQKKGYPYAVEKNIVFKLRG